MDSSYLPFIAFDEGNVSCEAPRILLDMEASGPVDLSVTLPYYVDFTIRRLADENDKPFIFRWGPYSDAFAHAQLVLLHITEHGPERVEVEPLEFAKPDEDTMLVHGWNQRLEELSSTDEIKWRADVTGNYQQLLKPGEKYELLWPGAEVAMWDWGSKADHVGKELQSRQIRQSKVPQLILPAAKVVAFTATQESEPWPDRPETKTTYEFQDANTKEADWSREEDWRKNPPPSPSPLDPSERVAGAPIFSMKIECPPEWKPDDGIFLIIRVTYEGVGDKNNARPITFHTRPFVGKINDRLREGLTLYRQRDGKWERIDPDDGCCGGFAIFDAPPIPVSVGGDGEYSDEFASLQPGDSWTTQRHVQGGRSWTSLPDDVEVGDTFKYVIKGAVVRWWDWGNKEDHKDTVVKLPCFIAYDVEEPSDNDGRPQLIVPHSNEVNFSYVG